MRTFVTDRLTETDGAGFIRTRERVLIIFLDIVSIDHIAHFSTSTCQPKIAFFDIR